jgi:hydrogenase maturation factor
LSYGGGGEETNSLIHNLFYKHFSNEILESAEDAAILSMDNKIAFTTDSFTISPLFFNGGDIGKLSIVGTCNDLAMMGAKPKYLSCSFIIEEGLSYEVLEKIGAKIVCGDTKVVPKGTCDKVFINTTGIGQVIKDGISAHNLQDGDVIGLCEIFGFELMDLANEGTFVIAITKDDAPKALEILQEFNKNASIIGKVTKGEKVVLKSPYGSQRYIDLPKGELLPRIC